MNPFKLAAALVAGGAALGPWTFGCSEKTAADLDPVDAGARKTPDTRDSGAAASEDACEPDAEDGECAACSRTSCCAEVTKYFGASGQHAFDRCVEPCADQKCVDACASTSPAAGSAYDALGNCQIDMCASPCICEVTDGDSTCLACTKQHCCKELVPYALASDFDGFSGCMEACTGEPCADACIAGFPVAGAAFTTYSECAFSDCPAECG